MTISELFTKLHNTPELSMRETLTKQILMSFFTENTSMEIHDMGEWFYAVHLENTQFENVALRADMDAITGTGGTVFHGCGHDGHCTTMARLALNVDRLTLNKNIFFIFQPAEENGQGAGLIAPHLKSLGISRIYGYHNIPGKRAHTALLRSGTFAYSSKGMTMRFYGKQSHAAYPETGINPAFAISQVLGDWDSLLNRENYKMQVLATVVNVSVGDKAAFGVNAGEGELSLTIRAELESDLICLQNKILDRAISACSGYGIELEYEFFDEFTETYNNAEQVNRAIEIFRKKGIPYEILSEPMRWSEDFGQYLKVIDGMFFGVGIGENYPPLHTDGYIFNLDIIDSAAEMLLSVIS